ncbi:MAG: hypothetical protein KKF85_09030 [Gammaproteobacteria bacterium]|nr:hypothetical protein [Rhodocyclaceae bacterium]MBU3908174.1 hypothetical protein [Gammaproteobacteria bacterium]MBU3988654.1 hypothetical protein [Gammaproteobacteria bacterium]MBU4003750.1 hypothetical protein [Gammaproteobacteria bacterium]MBU4022175.1 hypothetical protein [Gammaproteobacteria bacterium]
MKAKLFNVMAVILALGVTMNADAGLFGFGGTSWKEEVLLHDGSKLIVKRSQTYGGRHEIGQSPPVKEHTIRFELPNSGKNIEWTSEYGEELGRTNFNLLALHLLGGIPYLVTEPNLCLAYNKYGRPNPPYVIFKHDDGAWQRIPLSELPAEFKTINLIVNNGREEDIERAAKPLGYVSVESVQAINSSLRQPEYRTILREPLPEARVKQMCEVMIRYKCGWGAPGEFNKQYFESICK